MTLTITTVSTRNYGYPANQFFRGDIASNEAGDELLEANIRIGAASWLSGNVVTEGRTPLVVTVPEIL